MIEYIQKHLVKLTESLTAIPNSCQGMLAAIDQRYGFSKYRRTLTGIKVRPELALSVWGRTM